MSDLRKQKLKDHQAQYDGRWSCSCGHDYGVPLNVGTMIDAHLLEVSAADVWDEVLELLQNDSAINHYDLEHYQSLNPFREQEQHDD